MKKLEQEVLGKDQEIKSLGHKLDVSDGKVERLEVKVKEAKHAHEENEGLKVAKESLSRKVHLLEEELDRAENTLKETVDKYVMPLIIEFHRTLTCSRIDLGSVRWNFRPNTMDAKSNRLRKPVLKWMDDTRYGKPTIGCSFLTPRLSAGA